MEWKMTIDGTLHAHNENEKKFYNFIAHALKDKFVQRIETTTGSGVPDVYIEPLLCDPWFELKIVLKQGVLLRREQYAWAMRYAIRTTSRVNILALDMKEEKVSWWLAGATAFSCHLDVEPYGKKYVRILNQPYKVCHQDSISFRHMLGCE